MNITFHQQPAGETEKQYAEGVAARRNGGLGQEPGGRIHSEKRCQGRADAGAGGVYVPGSEMGGMSVKAAEKGKSLIELQQEAQNVDVGIAQDYMTVMSHTLSEEDYAKAQEEGFDLGSMNPEETVTIVDKIKAELVRSGKNVAGYTDDLDLETLTAILGSEALAGAVAQSFAAADLPLNRENLERVASAWTMAGELGAVEEGTARYLLDNGLDSEIWNLYLAENSGAAAGSAGTPAFAAEDVQGYYARNAEQRDWSELGGQIDNVIERSGRTPDEENREKAVWLLERELPLTAENLDRLEELQALELPVTPEAFSRAVANAVAEGKDPVRATLGDTGETLYEKAVRVESFYRSDETWEQNRDNIVARRQLEEIRLRMTAEVNVKLLKSGFSIDTAPMEELVAALRKAEEELARQYFPGDSQAVAKYQTFVRTEEVIRELPGLPAGVLGAFAEGQSVSTLEEFHGEGRRRQEDYEKAGQSYETLMTAPRRDLGDSIQRAFANVDDILTDMGRELTEENRRAMRILSFNRMELSRENLDSVLEADRQVQSVVEKLTPAATLKMIRDGVNPLEKSFAELERYFDALPAEYRQEAESYSRFLYGLERRHEVTPEERESFIGIYRLVRQIEKADGAAVGALVSTQAELHFSNLLSALRSGKAGRVDAKVDETFGTVAELVRRGESIPEQIGKAFAKAAGEVLTEVSHSGETARDYDGIMMERYREAVASADAECTALLQRGELPAAAENLLGAEALLRDASNPFSVNRGERRGEKLWERLDDPETFEEEYEGTVAEAKDEAEKATLEEADNSLDVRGLQLAHKQLTIAAGLARTQEFFLPMYLGDRLAKVHLVLKRGPEKAGTVEVQVKVGQGKGLQAEFGFSGGVLKGNLCADRSEEVMKCERIADIFKEEAGESWTVGEIGVTVANIGPGAAGAGMDAETENSELYRVAKVFLHSLQKEEVSYEN